MRLDNDTKNRLNNFHNQIEQILQCKVLPEYRVERYYNPETNETRMVKARNYKEKR